MYDIIENFKASEINISEEKIKNFNIFFLQFEKRYSLRLEKYKNIFYQKIGYVFCDFNGDISKKIILIY